MTDSSARDEAIAALNDPLVVGNRTSHVFSEKEAKRIVDALTALLGVPANPQHSGTGSGEPDAHRLLCIQEDAERAERARWDGFPGGMPPHTEKQAGRLALYNSGRASVARQQICGASRPGRGRCPLPADGHWHEAPSPKDASPITPPEHTVECRRSWDRFGGGSCLCNYVQRRHAYDLGRASREGELSRAYATSRRNALALELLAGFSGVKERMTVGYSSVATAARAAMEEIAHLRSQLDAYKLAEAGEIGGFGVDPNDSSALLELRSIIDNEIGWDSREEEEKADYPARLRKIAAELCKKRNVHS